MLIEEKLQLLTKEEKAVFNCIMVECNVKQIINKVKILNFDMITVLQKVTFNATNAVWLTSRLNAKAKPEM